MANRFTDSGKWDDPWFRKLPCKYKAFWLFILDKCNHAGIWKVDFESATFHIGEEITNEEVIDIFKDRFHAYEDKWFVIKFIFFQYGYLSESNRVHNSVIEILKKEGLFKVYQQTLLGLKDKDKNMDKDKDKDKDKVHKKIKTQIPENFSVTDRVKAWANEKGFDRLEDHLESFKRKVASNGYRYIDWDSAFMEAVREDWAKIRTGRDVSKPQSKDAAGRALKVI